VVVGLVLKVFSPQTNNVLIQVIARLSIVAAILNAMLWCFMSGLLVEFSHSGEPLFIEVVSTQNVQTILAIYSQSTEGLGQALSLFSSIESKVLIWLFYAWHFCAYGVFIGALLINELRRKHLMLLLFMALVLSSAAGLSFELTISLMSVVQQFIGVLVFITCAYLIYITASRDSQRSNRKFLVAYASQSGTAKTVAQQLAKSSRQYCDISAFGELSPNCLQQYNQLIVVAATYGDGQAPERSHGFIQALEQCQQGLSNLNYAVLALGDSAYPQFCAFGHRVATMLGDKGAQQLCPVEEIDRGHMPTINRWWQGICDELGWHVTEMSKQWLTATVTGNQCLNPQQPKRRAHLLQLKVAGARYQAGDLLEVLTPIASQVIRQRLIDSRLDPNVLVMQAGKSVTLLDALATLEWQQQRANDPQSLIDSLPALRPRVYSIASPPDEPVIEILVRQLLKTDGCLGYCSSLLCASEVGVDYKVSLRNHDSFRLPSNDVPLILICAGTGIAPFMSFLAQRKLQGFNAPVWLMFGEQYQDSGCYFKTQLEGYLQDGTLTKLSYAFSRDSAWLAARKPRYVDDIMLGERDYLVNLFTENDGQIFVCGNTDGIGASVKKALANIFAVKAENLLDNSRLHFDLY